MKASNILLLVVLLGVFYALLILPQRRQQKQRTTMMQQLGPGARVLTAGGIYMTVVAVHSEGITASLANGIEVELDNRAILRVVTPANTIEEAGSSTEDSASEDLSSDGVDKSAD